MSPPSGATAGDTPAGLDDPGEPGESLGPLAAQTWRGLLAEAAEVLGSSLDARRIAEEASGMNPTELLISLDEPVPSRAGRWLTSMVARRASGEPLQYALGRWGFRSLDLIVDRRVLIPRPETEQVVELAIDEARRMLSAERGRRLVMADLGTGSGAIALSVAIEVPGVEVWATDSSAAALEVASANLSGIGSFAATRVRLVQGCWYEALPVALRGTLDLIISNPPYVALDEVLPPEVERYEPATALRAGPTGLECLAVVVSEAPAWLSPSGVLVVESAPDQTAPVASLAREVGFTDVKVHTDLAGRHRAVVARR